MPEEELRHVTAAPLYGFSSDADVLQLDDGVIIERFHTGMLESAWKELMDFCRLFPPSFVLSKSMYNDKGWLNFVTTEDGTEIQRKVDLQTEFVDIHSWVVALQLFKPGVFRVGGTWNIALGSHENELVALQKSFMHAENATELYDRVRESPYKLDSDELPFLIAFRNRLTTSLKAAAQAPKFKVGLDYFNFSFMQKGSRYQFIDLVVCLEALFLNAEGELSQTLALRVACLLGVDADERQRIFNEVKRFYSVRSKVLHGMPLKEKHLKELDQVARLRELARKGLLAALALGTEFGFESEYFTILDEMVLDDGRRREFQDKASKLLFMDS